MPFIFRTTKELTVVDCRLRQGLICQSYHKGGPLRPQVLQHYSPTYYTASFDANEKIHIVTESSKTQIQHITFLGNNVQKKVILEDPQGLYKFKHLYLHNLNNELYLFYTVKHPSGNGRTLMYQPLIGSSNYHIQTLIQILPENTVMKMLSIQGKLYIIYTDFDQDHCLKLLVLNQGAIEQSVIHHSKLPIIDFNYCLLGGAIHLTLLKDAYGQTESFYFSTQSASERSLGIKNQSLSPCIISYNKEVWVTYTEESTLLMMLLSSSSNQFSVPVPCSLQSSVKMYSYYGDPHFRLNGTTLHATLSPPLRIGIVTSIDQTGIHPDLAPLLELELLLENLSTRSSPMTQPRVTSPSIPPTYSPPPLSPTPLQPTPDSTPMPPHSTDIESAKKDFMRGGSLFSFPPRD